MSFEFIRVEKTGHVTTVTLDRPGRMNALHPYAQIELDQAFDQFQSDDEQWVAIITGAGESAFCAGNDLKFQAEHGAAKVRELRRDAPGGFGGLHRRLRCYKPIIAAEGWPEGRRAGCPE